MPRMTWSAPEGRFFDAGLDRGVLYPKKTPPLGHVVATNLLPFGSFEKPGVLTTVERNELWNPSGAVAGGWVAVNGTNHVMSTDTTVFHSRGSSRKSTVQAAGAGVVDLASINAVGQLSSAGASRTAVAAGQIVSAGLMIRPSRASAKGKVGLVFYNASSVQVGAILYGSDTTLTSTGWTWVKISNKTVPATATQVEVISSAFLSTGTAAAGDAVWFDSAVVQFEEDVLDPFDGSTAASGEFVYEWAGGVDGSASLRRAILLSPTGLANGAVGIISTDWAQSGTKSLRIYSKKVATGGATINLKDYVTWGKQYTITATVRKSPALSVAAKIEVSTVNNTPNMTPASVSSTLISGVETLSLTFSLPPKNGASAAIQLFLKNNNSYGTNVWFDNIIITEGPEVYPYFDGNTPDDDLYDYAWVGTALDSVSEKREKVSLAVPWVGLTGVEEKGGDGAAAYYIDGRPFLFLPKPKEYSATLKAYTYPDAFAEIMGVTEIADGMYLDSQPGAVFDLAYRTKVGNATNGIDFGYKIHLVYNAVVTPQSLSYDTLGASINPVEFSWDIQAVPVKVEGFRPTAHIIIDTRHMAQARIDDIEALLYGSDSSLPAMPTPQTIFDMLSYGDTIIVTDMGDGNFSVEGAYENVYLVEPGVFRVDNVDGENYADGTFRISSTNV